MKKKETTRARPSKKKPLLKDPPQYRFESSVNFLRDDWLLSKSKEWLIEKLNKAEKWGRAGDEEEKAQKEIATLQSSMIEELLPDAKRGKKVLEGAKKSGKSKNEIFRALKPLYQREAEIIWNEELKLGNLGVATRLVDRINSRIELTKKIIKEKGKGEESWNENDPLNIIAKLLWENKMRANPNTIRKIIKKPTQKTRT